MHWDELHGGDIYECFNVFGFRHAARLPLAQMREFKSILQRANLLAAQLVGPVAMQRNSASSMPRWGGVNTGRVSVPTTRIFSADLECLYRDSGAQGRHR